MTYYTPTDIADILFQREERPTADCADSEAEGFALENNPAPLSLAAARAELNEAGFSSGHIDTFISGLHSIIQHTYDNYVSKRTEDIMTPMVSNFDWDEKHHLGVQFSRSALNMVEDSDFMDVVYNRFAQALENKADQQPEILQSHTNLQRTPSGNRAQPIRRRLLEGRTPA